MGGDIDNAAVFALYDAAFAHDISDPTGGDYAKFTMDQTAVGAGCATLGDEILYYILRYTPIYRTTKEQEDAVDAKVDTLVTAWKAQNLSDYKIIQTIYNYITANVAYDNEGLNDETDLTKYTAYGALCEGSACHTRSDAYLTDAFMQAYPMATYSYGNTWKYLAEEEDRGNIAFQIPHIGVDTTDWAPDCVWEEGEYAEIDVKRSWISAVTHSGINLDTAKNLPLKLGMSWDDEYIYTFLQFTDPNGHDNKWNSNTYGI